MNFFFIFIAKSVFVWSHVMGLVFKQSINNIWVGACQNKFWKIIYLFNLILFIISQRGKKEVHIG